MCIRDSLETADSPSPSNSGGQNPGHGSQSSLSSASQSVVSGGGQQGVQRVKSMFQQSTGKLGSSSQRLPGTHPAPPQRSISHNEVRMTKQAASRLLSNYVFWQFSSAFYEFCHIFSVFRPRYQFHFIVLHFFFRSFLVFFFQYIFCHVLRCTRTSQCENIA